MVADVLDSDDGQRAQIGVASRILFRDPTRYAITSSCLCVVPVEGFSDRVSHVGVDAGPVKQVAQVLFGARSSAG